MNPPLGRIKKSISYASFFFLETALRTCLPNPRRSNPEIIEYPSGNIFIYDTIYVPSGTRYLGRGVLPKIYYWNPPWRLKSSWVIVPQVRYFNGLFGTSLGNCPKPRISWLCQSSPDFGTLTTSATEFPHGYRRGIRIRIIRPRRRRAKRPLLMTRIWLMSLVMCQGILVCLPSKGCRSAFLHKTKRYLRISRLFSGQGITFVIHSCREMIRGCCQSYFWFSVITGNSPTGTVLAVSRSICHFHIYLSLFDINPPLRLVSLYGCLCLPNTVDKHSSPRINLSKECSDCPRHSKIHSSHERRCQNTCLCGFHPKKNKIN